MEILAKQNGEISVISVVGSIDALTAGELMEYLLGRLSAGNRFIILDLEKVDFMSSTGLRAMLTAMKEARQQGGDLCLAAAQPGVEKVLKMVGLTGILNFYPAVDQAMAEILA